MEGAEDGFHRTELHERYDTAGLKVRAVNDQCMGA